MSSMNFTIIDSINQQIDSFASIFDKQNFSDYEIIESKSNSSSVVSNGIMFPLNNGNFWNAIRKELSDMTNLIKFNILSKETKLDCSSLYPIQIFSNKFKAHYPEEKDKLLLELKNLIWFSYRSNFDVIVYNQQCFTSDAGWGCMIRAGQMILARGIYKLFNYISMNDFCENKLLLFADNQIPYEYLLKALPVNEFNNSNYLNGYKKPSSKATPPYSIRQICQISKLPKGAGDWFSNYDIISIFKEITDKYDPLTNAKILNFSEGNILLKDIIIECFEKVNCNCSILSYQKIIKSHTHQSPDIDFEIIEKTQCIEKKCKCGNETVTYCNEKYQMKKNFIMFISVRHGLYEIEEETKDAIIDYFNLFNNIGIIGGKHSRALYFIGYCQKNLIFLDPHFINDTCSIQSLLDNKKKDTYKPIDYYYMDINQMSPSFTMGFYCNQIDQFCELSNHLYAYSNLENKLFNIKQKEEWLNMKVNKS